MTRRLPPLNAIRAFEAAGRLSSISAAADELAVTPTAVSHQIRHLETLLKTRLFERTGRGVTLTEQGARILPQLSRGMDHLAGAFEEAFGQMERDTITLTTTREFARYWLQPRVGEFYAAFPALTLNILASETAADLAGTEIDVAVRYGARPAAASGETWLYQECYAAIASRSLLRGPGTRLEDLMTDRLIDVRWENAALVAPSWRAWFAEAGRHDFDAYRRTRFDAYNLAFDALRRGHGAALLSRTIITSREFPADMVALDGPRLPGYHYRILRAPAAARKRAVRQFVEWLTAAVSDLSGG